MATMIPSEIFYGIDTDSSAEMQLFDIIKNEPNTKDWIVFHSLNIKSHKTLTFTESDFVLLIPYRGIFIIEVKGGEIHYNDGRFTTINKYGKESSINPFEQVEKSWRGIGAYLKTFNFDKLLIAMGVAFTSIAFDINSIEYDKDMVYDINNDSFYDYIINLERLTKIHHPRYYKEFSGDTFKQVRELLRADYDLFVPPRQKLKDNDYQLKRLTKQQLDVIDSISCADRALVHGGAGTGKTYFAVEMAKRCYNNGYKVGIFSYNILLADYLKEQFPENKYPKIVTGAIIEYWINYCKDLFLLPNDFDPMKLPKNEMQQFYNKDIYCLVLKAFQLKPLDLDVLILDEAQDYVEPDRIMTLSLMLKNNLARGKWYMFGDFINQLIFDFSVYETNVKQYLKSMGVDNYIDKELSKNCRNSKAVANELLKLTGLDISTLEDNQDGCVEYIAYNDFDDEYEKFDKLISRLLEDDKILPENITILANCVLENSIVQFSKYSHIIKRYEFREKGIISYSRVRRFKGLENDIIIMLDLNGYKFSNNDKESISLLYSGVSRARHSCYVFETANEKNIRENAYFKGFSEDK